MSFKPPKGQSCANCLFFERTPGNDGIEPWAPVSGHCNREGTLGWAELIVVDAELWCGHWRGNASVRCGGCPFREGNECPRALGFYAMPQGIQDGEYELPATGMLVPSPLAFACERYEEHET